MKALFGQVIDFDWTKFDSIMNVNRFLVSNTLLNGKAIKELNIRSRFGANVAKVTRNGIDYVAVPDFVLQTGDVLTVVGTENALAHTDSEVSKRNNRTSYGDLIPIFIGIASGCVLAHIPFIIPGLPQPIKFGLAGGPMIIAILMGYFGTKHHLLNIATFSSGNMLREIGITMFLACVGLQAGRDFISTVVTAEAAAVGRLWTGHHHAADTHRGHHRSLFHAPQLLHADGSAVGWQHEPSGTGLC